MFQHFGLNTSYDFIVLFCFPTFFLMGDGRKICGACFTAQTTCVLRTERCSHTDLSAISPSSDLFFKIISFSFQKHMNINC